MKRIMFVGNSFTFFNDMPAMFEKLACAAGFDVTVLMVTKGGWYLNRYADPQNEMGQKLREVYPQAAWDYVILQDQSLNPAINPKDLVDSVVKLRQLMTGNEQLLMYQTWSYKAGSEKLEGTGLTYKEMHDALKDSYQAAADAVGGVCVPVGDAFEECFRKHPEIELYRSDSYHPSAAGSYLAACMFYALIADESPVKLGTPGEVDAKEAVTLREVAEYVWQQMKQTKRGE